MSDILNQLDLDIKAESKPVKEPKNKADKRRSRKITAPSRTAKIEVRCFPEEKEHIEKLALESTLKASEYIRKLAMNRLPESDIHERIEKGIEDRIEKLELEYQARFKVAQKELEVQFEKDKEKYLNHQIINMSLMRFFGLKADLKKQLKRLPNQDNQ